MTCFANAVTSGSSPHMRGTLRVGIPVRYEARIIPAYAGNTPIRTRTSTVVRDHPRICGEHLDLSTVVSATQGSSPHMRGTLDVERGGESFDGIIPAYAGNTCLCGNLEHFSGDHPRICGEHKFDSSRCDTSQGSSPHMRGTQGQQGHRHARRGIIPAYAGNTSVG